MSMKSTKKRNTTSLASILTARPDQKNGIMNGSRPSFGIYFFNFRFRRRKNFSLILLAGLSALLCALYYTSYYPGTVWTLRFGMTSLTGRYNNETNGEQQAGSESSSQPEAQLAQTNSPHNHNHHGGDGLKPTRRDFTGEAGESGSGHSRKLHDGFGGNNSAVIWNRSDGSNPDNNYNHYQRNGNNREGKVSGQISTSSNPKVWNWKYWESLLYWKVNDTASDEISDELFPDVSGDRDGVQPFPDSNSPRGAVSLREGSGTMSAASDAPVTKKTANTVHSQHPGRGHGLACKFPRLNPFDPSIIEFIKSPTSIDCSREYPLLFRTNFRNKLIMVEHSLLTTTLSSSTMSTTTTEGDGDEEMRKVKVPHLGSNYTCCYKTITRGNKSDHNIIYSKRCYPILGAEMEIPASHEFISVRCRSLLVGKRTRSQSQTKGPTKLNKETNNNNGTTDVSSTNTNNSTANNNNTDTGNKHDSNDGVISNHTILVYKDIMTFVPLKPLVEDRIRKYEESKRKFLYALKKADISNKRGMLDVEVSNTQQKQQQLREGSRVENKINEKDERIQLEGEQVEGRSRTPTPNEDRLSVVILGMDAQSHMNFIRQMPQTYKFLTKNLTAIGMYGYTKVGDNTFPNAVAALAGMNESELEKTCWPTKQSYFDKCPFIWKKFAQAGYRTSLAEDSVWMGIFNYDKKGFFHSPTDYFLHPIMLLMASKIGHESQGNAKLCYGPRLAFEVLLDYLVKTAVAFRGSLYFQFMWSNSLFHDFLNNPQLGDELLYMTLKFLRNNGFFNNTAFILLSDHGIRWGDIRNTYQGKIEERMPLIYFLFPTWFRHKYPLAMRNLKKNAMRLTTPFDLHETLLDIIDISEGKPIRFDKWKEVEGKNINNNGGAGADGASDEKPPRGISLFRPVPLSRTCSTAGIDEHWCVCHSMKSVPSNSTLVRSGAQFIVQLINGLLRKHSGLCAKLKLFKINEAKRKIDGDIDRGLDVDFFPKSVTTRVEVEAGTVGESNLMVTSNSTQNEVAVGPDANGNRNGTHLSSHKPLHDNIGINASTTSSAGIDATATPTAGDSTLMSLSTSSDIKRMIQLEITFQTQPGDAIFEATIYGEAVIIGQVPVTDDDIHQEDGERSSHHWKLAGDISRLNLYGAQSTCISDYLFQKYCYCKNLLQASHENSDK